MSDPGRYSRTPFEWTIRPATEADAPRIAEIYNEAVRTTVATFDTEPRSLEAQIAWCRSHDQRHPVVVAEKDHDVVGWGALSPWSERAAYGTTVEDSLYVDSRARGRGVGRALLSVLIERAEWLRLHTVLARVAGGNPTSLRLHAAFGFAEVGVMREVGFKFGRWVDVHLLQRVLASAEAALFPDHRSG